MKLFQTSQNEVINTSMITNIKPIHNRELGKEDAERLYTRDEYNSIIDSKDVKKCRVMRGNVSWGQVDFPVVAYKVTTTNGSVVISVPDYERLIKTLSSWLTDDAGDGEDVAEGDDYDDDEFTEPVVKLTQDVFKHPQCPTWAKWAAIDENGTICVYDKKPYVAEGYFSTSPTAWSMGDGRMEHIYVLGWKKTLIKREE